MYIGIDLGGTNIAVGLVQDDYRIVDKISTPTKREREFFEIMADAANLINSLLERNELTISSVRSIGIGAPGVIDVNNKMLLYISTFPNIHNASFKNELEKYFPNVPVYVENDANAAAYGEVLAGAAREFNDVIMITLGTGVGGGVVIDKKIYSGFNHAGSELGCMVINFNGPLCDCGRKGCFEVYASATALIRQTKEIIQEYPNSIIHTMIDHNYEKINGKTAFDAAKMNDEAGEKIVSRYVEYLGVGIVNLINIFQPEAIVIGGGICKEGEYLLSRLNPYVEQFIYTPDGVPTAKLLTAELGNDAGIIGAAMLWKMQI